MGLSIVLQKVQQEEFIHIPLGIQVSSLVKNKKEKALLLCLLVISSIVGVALINVFKITLDEGILGILISITLGMLIYISMFELLCEIKEHIKDKMLWIGFVLGLVVATIGLLI